MAAGGGGAVDEAAGLFVTLHRSTSPLWQSAPGALNPLNDHNPRLVAGPAGLPGSARGYTSGSPRRSLAKAVSWRLVGTLDTLVLSFLTLTFLGPVLGIEGASHAENVITSSYIALAELVTKVALYYVHERAWERVRWNLRTDGRGNYREGNGRSVAKTASWRVLASFDTTLLALIFTGSPAAALSIGGLEVITKLGLYYLHERAWSRIGWGAAQDEQIPTPAPAPSVARR